MVRGFKLVRSDQKHTRVHFQRLEVGVEQPGVPLHQLGDELHVRVCAFAALFYFLVSLLVGYLFRKDTVSDHDGCGAADPLHTVHIDSSALVSSLLNPGDCIVENA
jgi:hypothetical protein